MTKIESLPLHRLMTPNPVVLDEPASLDDALAVLQNYSFRHLPVIRGNEIVGILSDRDLRLATSLIPTKQRTHDKHGTRVPGPERVGEVMRSPVHCLGPDDDVGRAAQDMLRERIGAIPIVEERQVVGILTETDLLKFFVESCRQDLGETDDVAENQMHRPMPQVAPDVTVEDALDGMDAKIGHLGVVEDQELIGIVSERDLFCGIARAMVHDAKAQSEGRMDDATTLVQEVMTKEVLVVAPDAALSHCAKGMIDYQVSAMPVAVDGKPVGILTQRDVLEYFIHATK